MSAETTRGLVDTNVLILRRVIDPAELPEEIAVSAISMAELAAGVQLVRGDDAEARRERAGRTDILQRAEHEFDPISFGAEAARLFGRISAAVAAIGRTPRRRTADLMIAAIAAAEDLPLYTTNADDFAGLERILTVVSVTRPVVGRA